MRDQSNEIYAQLRERELIRTGEKHRLANEVPRPQRKPFYAPLLAYAGAKLIKIGAMLQERYARSADTEELQIEAVSD